MLRLIKKTGGVLLASMLVCLAACAAGGGPAGGPFPSEPLGADNTLAAPAGQKAPVAEENANKELLECFYYDSSLFSYGERSETAYEGKGRIAAGIVPHHLLASDMISGFFRLASENSYDTVVIFAPVHFPEMSAGNVISSERGWNSPFGVVECDSDLIFELLHSNVLDVELNDRAIEMDHGVAGLIPYVASHLPGARVVACLLSPLLSEEEIAALAELGAGTDKSILYLVSADFSHYQQPKIAEEKDNETRRAVSDKNHRAILAFNSSNVDTPQGLSLFLRVAERKGLEAAELDNSNSRKKTGLAEGSPAMSEGITSYFIYAAFEE